ncbi:hypothetical protein ACS0TY_001265 [Phlomoides rotata]
MENSTGDGRYTDIDMVEYRLLWLRNHFAVSVGNIGICSKPQELSTRLLRNAMQWIIHLQYIDLSSQIVRTMSDIPEQSGSRRLELLLMEEENDKVEVRSHMNLQPQHLTIQIVTFQKKKNLTLFVMSCEGDRLWEVDNMIVEEGRCLYNFLISSSASSLCLNEAALGGVVGNLQRIHDFLWVCLIYSYYWLFANLQM